MPKVQPKTSEAWKYFKIENKKAICQVENCDGVLAWHVSTTALLYHLRAKHSNINLNPEESVPSSSIRDESNNSFDICATYQFNHQEVLLTNQHSQEIDQALYKWVEEYGQPACIMESSGFKDLLNLLKPNYLIPSAQEVTSMINEKCEMTNYFSQRAIDSPSKTRKFSLNVSVLRDSKQWLCLSVYFLSDTWEMKSYKIGTVKLAQLGESADIVEWLKVKTQEADIHPSSVVAIVHDCEEKIANAAKRLAGIFDCSAVVSATSNLDAMITHVCKHVLTPSIIRSIMKIKDTISNFDDNRSCSIFLKMLPQKENPLKADTESVSTEGVLVNPSKPVLEMENYECGDQQTTNGSWNFIQTIVNELQPFEVVIKYLCNENKFVGAASSSPALYDDLKRKLQTELKRVVDIGNPVDSVKRYFKTKLLDMLKKATTFEKKDIKVMIKAAALDPRNKSLTFFSPEVKCAVFADLIDECCLVHSEDLKQDSSTSTDSSTRNDDLKNSNSLVNTLLELGSGCSESRKKMPSNDKNQKLKEKIGMEMDTYYYEKPCQNDICPLSWWSTNQHKYPLLAVLARSYLSVPA